MLNDRTVNNCYSGALQRDDYVTTPCGVNALNCCHPSFFGTIKSILFVALSLFIIHSAYLATEFSSEPSFVNIFSLSSNQEYTVHQQEHYPEQHRHPNDIVFLTFSDRVVDGLCYSVATASLNGIDIQVMGMEDGFDFSHTVKNAKTRKLHAWTKLMSNQTLKQQYGIGDSTIVTLADASDVLYFDTPEAVHEKFVALENRLNLTDKLVLIGAERNCWPYMDGNQKIRLPEGMKHCSKFPSGDSTFRYLNSGSIMGRSKNLASLLLDVHSAMKSVDEDDQGCLQKAYSTQVSGRVTNKYTIALDHRQDIFQTGWGTNLENGLEFSKSKENDAFYDRDISRVVNTEHFKFPSVVHFNGGKNAYLPIAINYIKNRAVYRSSASVSNLVRNKKMEYTWFSNQCSVVLGALECPPDHPGCPRTTFSILKENRIVVLIIIILCAVSYHSRATLLLLLPTSTRVLQMLYMFDDQQSPEVDKTLDGE
jgi:hypothetical protein